MHRATKSGLGAEAHAKIVAKYDPNQASECLTWVQTILANNDPPFNFDTDGDRQNFNAVLEDGYVLAHLINALEPESIPSGKLKARPKMQFKKMELIDLFLAKIKPYGVPDHERFATIDLTESQDLNQVVICLQALARKARTKGHVGFGPKESEANIRNFTEDQLKAGKSTISLQYGSNAGASQAGMNFGKTRMILD